VVDLVLDDVGLRSPEGLAVRQRDLVVAPLADESVGQGKAALGRKIGVPRADDLRVTKTWFQCVMKSRASMPTWGDGQTQAIPLPHQEETSDDVVQADGEIGTGRRGAGSGCRVLTSCMVPSRVGGT